LSLNHFITALAVIVIFPLFLNACSEEEWPEGCLYGEIILPNFNDPDTPGAYFDFSEGEIVFGEEGRLRGDIYLEQTFIKGNPEHEIGLHDEQPDSLLYKRSAPSWGSARWKVSPNPGVPPSVPLYEGHNIWVRTAEGHTAKFKILTMESNENHTSYNWIKIRWIYQPDGSTSF